MSASWNFEGQCPLCRLEHASDGGIIYTFISLIAHRYHLQKHYERSNLQWGKCVKSDCEYKYDGNDNEFVCHLASEFPDTIFQFSCNINGYKKIFKSRAALVQYQQMQPQMSSTASSGHNVNVYVNHIYGPIYINNGNGNFLSGNNCVHTTKFGENPPQNVNVSNFSSCSINSVLSGSGSTHSGPITSTMNNNNQGAMTFNGSMTFNDSVNLQLHNNNYQSTPNATNALNTTQNEAPIVASYPSGSGFNGLYGYGWNLNSMAPSVIPKATLAPAHTNLHLHLPQPRQQQQAVSQVQQVQPPSVYRAMMIPNNGDKKRNNNNMNGQINFNGARVDFSNNNNNNNNKNNYNADKFNGNPSLNTTATDNSVLDVNSNNNDSTHESQSVNFGNNNNNHNISQDVSSRGRKSNPFDIKNKRSRLLKKIMKRRNHSHFRRFMLNTQRKQEKFKEKRFNFCLKNYQNSNCVKKTLYLNDPLTKTIMMKLATR